MWQPAQLAVTSFLPLPACRALRLQGESGDDGVFLFRLRTLQLIDDLSGSFGHRQVWMGSETMLTGRSEAGEINLLVAI